MQKKDIIIEIKNYKKLIDEYITILDITKKRLNNKRIKNITAIHNLNLFYYSNNAIYKKYNITILKKIHKKIKLNYTKLLQL